MNPTPRSAALDRALADVKSRLAEAFGERLREVRLFGSMARGEAGPDSDVDVLVLLDRLESSHERIAAIDVVLDEAGARAERDRTQALAQELAGFLRKQGLAL